MATKENRARSAPAAHFFKRYPVPLREALLSPLVFHYGVPLLAAAPPPGQAILRDTALFAGHRDGAIRTALSRMRDSGELERYQDAAGRECYRLNAMYRVINAVVSNDQRSDGIIVAVTAFHKGEESERKYLRQLLQYTGFKPLVRNVYVNGAVDTAPVEAALKERGLRDRLWLFPSMATDDALIKRLRDLFNVDQRVETLQTLCADYQAFLFEPGIDGREFARRVLYAGPVEYWQLVIAEPPLPKAVLPQDYPFEKARSYLPRAMAERAADLVQHYRRMAGQ